MKLSKVMLAFTLAVAILLGQMGVVMAAPAQTPDSFSGTVQTITIEADIQTGAKTVVVTLVDENNTPQTFHLSIKTALKLGLILPDENGVPVINQAALGSTLQIDPATALPDEIDQHPVAAALATFFEDVTDYAAIMQAHQDGYGFGVIAQALWLTRKLKGDTTIFLAVLKARTSGDFSDFRMEDGTSPTSWDQFRKAVLDNGKKGSLGIVMSNKEDKDHANNGQGHDNNNDQGKGHDNQNNQDKGNGNKPDKDKGNGKDK